MSIVQLLLVRMNVLDRKLVQMIGKFVLQWEQPFRDKNWLRNLKICAHKRTYEVTSGATLAPMRAHTRDSAYGQGTQQAAESSWGLLKSV